jgi:hypothetical protein
MRGLVLNRVASPCREVAVKILRPRINYTGAILPGQYHGTPIVVQPTLAEPIIYRNLRILFAFLPLNNRDAMATWILTCKCCRRAFTYSEIPDTLADLFLAQKPQFPPDGLERACPFCDAKFVYQRSDLVYREVRVSASR